jgi:metal-responsive CopG/Arc/MetJ family transcriptional regulator
MKKKRNKDCRRSVSIAFPPQLLRELDMFADNTDATRSRVVTAMVRAQLQDAAK